MIKAKITFLVSLTALTIIAFCGCDKKDMPKAADITNNAAAVKNREASTKALLSNKLVTLTWASNDSYYSPASLNNDLEVWKEIEKRTNVKIKWEPINRSRYDAEMQVKISSGGNLPDILVVPNFDPTQYGQSGLFIPLEELIEKHAPNIRKIFNEYPEVKELMTSADGHIYGLAPIIKGSADTLPLTFTIRKDWLKKLGMREPNTVEEWYQVLKAFQEKDPNGNGKKDEIPFGSSPYYLSEAFGLQLMSGSDYIVENNRVIYQWTDQRMISFLRFARKLYEEGLLDNDFGVDTCETTEFKVINDRIGAYVNYPDWISSWQKLLYAKGKKNALYMPILPPQGEGGERSLDSPGIIDKRFSSISKDCKDPVIAIKLLDYLWSEEGIRYMAWGIEGKTYVLEDGKPKLTEYVTNNKEGLGMSDVLRKVGAWPTVPWVQQREQYLQILSLDENFKNFPEMIKPVLKEPFPMLLANKEEQDRLIMLETNITSYREEMMVKIITGEEPVENFDKYVNTLKSMGLEELVSIKQKQYERYINHK